MTWASFSENTPPKLTKKYLVTIKKEDSYGEWETSIEVDKWTNPYSTNMYWDWEKYSSNFVNHDRGIVIAYSELPEAFLL